MKENKLIGGIIIVDSYAFPIKNEGLKIGRLLSNDVVIENVAISREHAMISYENNHYVIFDNR